MPSKTKLPNIHKLTVRVKTAKRRKTSSTAWLERQLNDPYVLLAKKEGYRSRAAYKLLEINDKFNFLLPGKKVLDLGAAPGGWMQVAVNKVGAGNVLGIDLMPIEPLAGAATLQKDFLDDDAEEVIKRTLNASVDVVLSDMAAPACGHTATDHLRIIALCEAAFEFAFQVLNEKGVFVAKILKGGTEATLLTKLKQRFEVVKHCKPRASRADSAESYVVAIGFRR